MHKNLQRQQIRMVILLLIGFVVFIVIFQQVVVDNPVFNTAASEQQTVSWEEYLSNRERMNEAKMKLSYQELMSLGRTFTSEKAYAEALHHFYLAKTIYPDKIAPRKNLCYSYLMLCQEDWRYCDKGKKELYYAMKYVQPEDKISYEYLYHLVELVQMEEIVEMDEGAALAAIF